MRRLLFVALLVGVVVWPGAYCPGLHSSTDFAKSSQAGQSLGAKTMRVEFPICSSASSLDSAFTTFANRGIRVLPLAGFHGTLPSQGCAVALGSWAARFGDGGSFWASYGGTDLPITHIEFGNETSYAHQYPACTSQNPGAWWTVQCYRDRAGTYATRAAEAIFAIGQTGTGVALIVQADDGGSANSAWVNQMFDAVPNLGDIVGGWSVHPYGPSSRWDPKLTRLINFTAANGAPATVPIDVTEYGISTDNGATVSPDNYGHPTSLSYSAAASTLESNVAGIRAKLGSRLQHFIFYAAHDLRNPGVKECGGLACREQFFGGLQLSLGEKGAFSTELRDQLDE